MPRTEIGNCQRIKDSQKKREAEKIQLLLTVKSDLATLQSREPSHQILYNVQGLIQIPLHLYIFSDLLLLNLRVFIFSLQCGT
jgi:hypothetical protein